MSDTQFRSRKQDSQNKEPIWAFFPPLSMLWDASEL